MPRPVSRPGTSATSRRTSGRREAPSSSTTRNSTSFASRRTAASHSARSSPTGISCRSAGTWSSERADAPGQRRRLQGGTFRATVHLMDESNPPVSTGRGDDGTTTLLGSGRMAKDDPRIAALGDIDEASSFIGLARAEPGDDLAGLLLEMQRLLYRVMGDVAMPNEENAVGEEDLGAVDGALEERGSKTETPHAFVV